METKKDKFITFRVKVINSKKYDWAFTLIVQDKNENDFYLVNKNYAMKCGMKEGFCHDISVTINEKGYVDKIKKVH